MKLISCVPGLRVLIACGFGSQRLRAKIIKVSGPFVTVRTDDDVEYQVHHCRVRAAEEGEPKP